MGTRVEFPSREAHFKSIIEELAATFEAKNSDYGGSVDVTRMLFGRNASLIRIWDKVLRLTTLTEKDSYMVKDETIIDTLKDLANYSIIAIMQEQQLSAPETIFDLIKNKRG